MAAPLYIRLVLLAITLLLFTPDDSQSQTFGKPEGEISSYQKKKRRFSKYFQGNKKERRYFEGWYFKMVSEDGSSVLSLIPGVVYAKEKGKGHAFIQVINGNTGETGYHQYPLSAFTFSKDSFYVTIGGSTFSDRHLHLEIGDSLTGDVYINHPVRYPMKRGAPGWLM